MVRSQIDISSLASGMLGRSTHCRTSSGTPSSFRAGPHQAHRLVGRLAARRMRREDHRVLALDRVDRDADRRDVGTGDRNERADDAGRLRVLDDALLRNLLDDAHALLAQRVAKDAEHLAAAAAVRGCPSRFHRRSCSRGGLRCPDWRWPRRRPGTGDRPWPGRSPRWRPWRGARLASRRWACSDSAGVMDRVAINRRIESEPIMVICHAYCEVVTVPLP